MQDLAAGGTIRRRVRTTDSGLALCAPGIRQICVPSRHISTETDGSTAGYYLGDGTTGAVVFMGGM